MEHLGKHTLKTQQYLLLVAVMLSAPIGDSLLARGMREVGPVDLHHLSLLWHALFNPWVDGGIVLLIGFFASYTTVLSWADLTFVTPATAGSYVIVALLGHFFLHEHLSLMRCLGIALIMWRRGFRRWRTGTHGKHGAAAGRCWIHAVMPTTPSLQSWLVILFVAAFAVVGEVLMAGGMRQLGDLDVIRERTGLPGAIRAVLGNVTFLLGALCMALNFFLHAVCAEHRAAVDSGPSHWRPYLCRKRG